MKNAVKITHLSVILGGTVKAIKDISVNIPIGKVVGLIGPSGSGKTTLMRSIVGRLYIDSGKIEIFGLPAGSPELRHQVSYMTQELSVYPDLTVKENLQYFATMIGYNEHDSRHAVANAIKSVGLVDKSNNLVRNLSSGQKQRVSLSIAMIGSPKLMILDEPTVGLDPVLRDNLWKLFKTLSEQGTTLIISSHSMEEAERCDDLLLIRDGKLIAHNSPLELRKITNTKTVEKSFLKLVGAKE